VVQIPDGDSGLADPFPIANAMLALEREMFDSNDAERAPPGHGDLEQLAALAGELAAALNGDLRRFLQLDAQLSGTRFTELLLDLPLQLSEAGAVDSALTLARAFAFIAPDTLRGDQALILAEAGRREEALLLVTSNLEQAEDIPSAEAKAGDVYRALGEADSAEAYYRRSLAESHTSLERSEALTRLVSLLCEIGRERDASDLLQLEEQRFLAPRPAPVVRDAPKVGRNDPCPCGSGKKYKKCHGAGG
jgi:tetratricopeptide (TPR) repeat protein